MTLYPASRTVRRFGMSVLAAAAAIATIWLIALPPAQAATPAVPPPVPALDVPAAQVSAAAAITIPLVTSPQIAFDGSCGMDEYGYARLEQFQEFQASGEPFPTLGDVFLQHDNTYLYVCMRGNVGLNSPSDKASVYIDTDNGREPWATYDDLSLIVDGSQNTSTFRGTGAGGYLASALSSWDAKSLFGNRHEFEYKIAISSLTTGGLCNRTFGLAVYHLWLNWGGNDYGWPSNQWYDQPQTWQAVQLANASCKPTLPVYAPLPVDINQGTANGLAHLLAGIGGGTDSFTDTVGTGGRLRFNVVNSDTGAFLEQYAGGGFFALNPSQAFTVAAGGSLVPGDVSWQACAFLKTRSFFAAQALPDARPTSCQGSPLPYRVTPILAAFESYAPPGTAAQAATVVTTGYLVQVPLGVDVGGGNPIMLAGPGGHLSLIFNNTSFVIPVAGSTQAALTSLDDTFLGVSAVAVPFSRTLVSRGDYGLHDSAVAVQRLQTVYAGAIITPGVPDLVYYVADAAEDPQSLAPVWLFPDAMALVDGHEVDLRGYADVAVDGFVPDIAITAPANGSVFIVGRPLVVTATVTGGAAPYTYTWLLDDGSSATGYTQGGLVTLNTTLPPPRSGETGTVSVRLHVMDSNGGANQALLALQPGPIVYLPLVMRNSAATQAGVARAQGVAPAGVSPQVAYWFGIEAGWDYPPYGAGGPDLGGVIPDANGFKSGMESLGWGQRFYWANGSAWEKDWRDCTYPGGNDCTYGVDRADFVYYAGHGGGGGIALPSNTHDTSWADANKMAFNTVKWVGFASCQTLRAQFDPAASAPIRRFFPSFNGGARLLLGFNSNMGDVAFGPRFVDNMRVPIMYLPFGITLPMPWAQHTIAEAWVMTAFEMNAGKPAYLWVTGNGQNPFYDRLPGPYTAMPSAQPYPIASWQWVWWDQ